MADMMTFPETWEEFEKSYGFDDSDEVYTNGSRLIPSFRVKQWLDHIAHLESKRQATNSNDCISRQAAIDTEGLDEQIRCEMCRNPMHTSRGCDGNCKYDKELYERIMQILDKRIKPLPSAQPYLQQTCSQLATDTIDRQAAMDFVGSMEMCDEISAEAYKKLMNYLEELPSAQPERPSGEWTEKEVIQFDDLEAKDIITEWQSAKCDVCGKYHTTPYMYYFSDYEYCPNCGADMRGEKDG